MVKAVDVYLAYDDYIVRIIFWGNEIESIHKVDPLTGKIISEEDKIQIYPANLFVTSKDVIDIAINEISNDLEKQINFFESEGKFSEAKRIKERTSLDGAVLIALGLMILFLAPLAKIAAGLAIAYGVWTIWKAE